MHSLTYSARPPTVFPAMLRSLGRGRWIQPARPRWTGAGPPRRTEAPAGTPQGGKKLKTYDELPGPGLPQSIYWLCLKGYILRAHELQVIQKKMYGPIWKSSIGGNRNVNIASPELMERVLRQEGKHPMRFEMDFWKDHRAIRKLAYGPLTGEGEQWSNLRTVLNKRMLLPREAARYTGTVNEVVTDLIARIRRTRKESASGVTVDNVADLLYRFSLESISSILFETRIGSLEKELTPETQRFIDSIGSIMKNSQYIVFLPKWSRGLLPYWRRFMESWDTVFAYAKRMIDKKMQEIQVRLDSGKAVEGEYLTYLLSDGKMTLHEAYGSIAELLQAGVDTTSNTLSWTLYHLAKDPEVQNALHQEVVSIVPGDRSPTAADFVKMPLLKAVIKETLRMYPVVPLNGRVAVEKETVIGDYYFPKDTQFVLCHYALTRDESSFPEPDRFLPQRWLRDGDMTQHPFSSIPFGFGVRACVGRRIAEMEMYLALSRIMQTFEVIPAPNLGDLKAVDQGILISDKPINLQFLDRERR